MPSVRKANGEVVPFSEEKVRQSIQRAGIPQELQQEVINHIKTKLFDGISTAEIYGYILEFLEHSPHPYTKARYSLKSAIMDLGPTGYPFEDFIAAIFK